MPDVKWIINKRNKTVLNPSTSTSERTFNCVNKEKCPLQEKYLTNNMYKATSTSDQDNYQHKIASPKPNSNSDMQTTQNPSGMRSIEATLKLQRNFGVLKTTTPQILYGKYSENTRRITLIRKRVPCVYIYIYIFFSP